MGTVVRPETQLHDKQHRNVGKGTGTGQR